MERTEVVARRDTLIGRFGTFAAGLRFEHLPDQAVHRAKQILLDTMGTAMGGYRTELGRQVADFTHRMYPGTQATMITDGRCASIEGAAFANATMAKILGMDDSHRAYGHVAAEIVPAALAAAEAKHRPGRAAIVAMVAGYEVFGRIGRQMRRTQLERGYDIKGMVGALGSATAAACALELEADGIAHALALATSLASGLETYVYDPANSHTKDLISGFGARNGVFAALLAQEGFRGPRGAIEGENGFAQGFGDAFDAQRVAAGLGSAFEIETAGFKPHAGCRHVHQGVDAACEVRRQIQLDPTRIARVDVGTYQHAIDAPFRTTLEPETASAAGYSLPTAVIIGLLFGSFYPEDIARFDDPRVRSLLPKVFLHVDPAIQHDYPNRNGCSVRVTLDDGRVVEGYVEHAKGEPENTLTDEEVVGKFQKTVGDLLPAAQINELVAVVWDVEQVSDIGALLRLASIKHTQALLIEEG